MRELRLDNFQGTAVRVLGLLQVVGHPRDAKRIEMLKMVGYDVKVLAFNRPYHGGRVPDCEYEILGTVYNRRYWHRALTVLRSLPTIRRAIGGCDVIYASGQDMGLAAILAGVGLGKPVVLEVGDIADIQMARSIAGRLWRCVDRITMRRYSLLVVISEGFFQYYHGMLESDVRALVIENKLEREGAAGDSVLIEHSQRDVQSLQPVPERLRIGYFGLLRDLWSWRVLRNLATSFPDQVVVVLAGMVVNPVDLTQQVSLINNIEYRGEYRSPQDLPDLYGRVDMVWACYPPIKPDQWNLRWGRPNRYYEACYYQRPMFARGGSLFARDVARHDIGMTIWTRGVNETVRAIMSEVPKSFGRWRANLAALDEDIYVLNTEYALLKGAIDSLPE